MLNYYRETLSPMLDSFTVADPFLNVVLQKLGLDRCRCALVTLALRSRPLNNSLN